MADYTLLLAELVEAVQKITSAAPDMTGAEILAALAGVDGGESGLDADMLDGLHASQFVRRDGSINGTQAVNGHIDLSGDFSAQEVTVNSILRVKDSAAAVRVMYSAIDDALVFYGSNIGEVARISAVDGKITAASMDVGGSILALDGALSSGIEKPTTTQVPNDGAFHVVKTLMAGHAHLITLSYYSKKHGLFYVYEDLNSIKVVSKLAGYQDFIVSPTPSGYSVGVQISGNDLVVALGDGFSGARNIQCTSIIF